MVGRELHGWEMSYTEAVAQQRKLAGEVSQQNEIGDVHFIAGVDVSAKRGRESTASVVILSYPELRLVEIKVESALPVFPYIPGLLSFRESPLILAAFAKLDHKPDLIMVDGHGLAHPRRAGIACHLGLWLDKPVIGCAKSLLIGEHGHLDEKQGSYAGISDKGDLIGAAVRTRTGVKPVYVSIGHKVDLKAAIAWTLKCCRGLRLPEPTRLAHMAAGGNLSLDMVGAT